jgi:lipid II:glycine glycyltransferase (peptidoglycan interpeptide bridge formation enzyme)
MSMPRRRLIRPAIPPAVAREKPRQIQKVRDRLEKERAALGRWQKKLKRAFNAVEKSQKRVSRLERQINHLEE